MDIVNRQQLSVLVRLAKVDKEFALVEKKLINKLAESYGFSKGEIEELIRNPEPVSTYGALSESKKFEYLYNLIDLMLIDKKIHKSEVIFCQNMAVKLGYHKDVVGYMTELMQVETPPDPQNLHQQVDKFKLN